jgi:hypothetical protein
MASHNNEHEHVDAATDPSRRRFLKYAAGGMAGIALFTLDSGRSISKFSIESAAMDSLNRLERSVFAQHLGEIFTIRRGALDTVDIELVEVSDFLHQDTHPVSESFSIVFRGSKYHPLEQGTYEVEHSAIGTFFLFIVPIYHEEGSLNYEAVFNRLKT